jgi:hypothetical protein
MTLPEPNAYRQLETDVEEELAIAESSHPGAATGVADADWLLSQADAERELSGLRSLLGAVQAMETDDPGIGPTVLGTELPDSEADRY